MWLWGRVPTAAQLPGHVQNRQTVGTYRVFVSKSDGERDKQGEASIDEHGF